MRLVLVNCLGSVNRPRYSVVFPPVILLLAVPRRLYCFGSLVILDVVCRYLSLFLLYMNIKVGKKDVTVRLVGGPLYGKKLFSWLSLVMF